MLVNGELLRFRDLEIELTSWPFEGEGIGFLARVAGEAPDGSRMKQAHAVPNIIDPRRIWSGQDAGIGRVLAKLADSPSTVSDDEIMVLGCDLADLALPAERTESDAKSVREIFNASYRAVARDGAGLRLRLRIEVEELKQLPWEFLYVAGEGRDGFLALNHDISIVRTDVTDVRDYRPRSRGAVRLSLVLAGLAGEHPLNVTKDHEAITAAVDTINEQLGEPSIRIVGQVDLKRPVGIEDVHRLLDEATDIFYFAGHGELREIRGKPETVLVLGSGPDDFLAAPGFAGLLAGTEPRLAMLGACDSARRDPNNPWNGMAAELIKRAVPAVIGHQFPIHNVAARDFATNVFVSTLQRRTIDEAVARARLALRTRPGVDWGIPALYLDNGNGVLFPGEAGAFGETQKALETIDRSAMAKRLLAHSPFRGVGHYRREHRPFFFGRETVDERAVEALDTGVDAVTVHGPAGCGKTSLLLAGIAALRDGIVVRLDDYSSPVDSFRDALATEGLVSPQVASWHDLALATGSRRLVLILDQFERVFEMGERQRDAVVEQLGILVTDKPDTVDVLVGIRSDAYGKFDEMRRSIGLTDHPIRIDLLNRSEAREALIGAFQAVRPGIAITSELADRIVRDLDLLHSTATDAIDPALLQIVGESVFKTVRERSVDPDEPLAVLETDYAGAPRIIAGYLRHELENQFPDIDAAEAVLHAVAASREDGWVRRSGLETTLPEATLARTLQNLAYHGFLARRTAPEELEYQFAGPAVRQVVTDWAGEDVRRLQAGRRILCGLAAGWNSDGDLASDRDLERLKPLADRLDPNPDEALLLLRSAVANHQDASQWLQLIRRGDVPAMIDPLEDGVAADLATVDQVLLGLRSATSGGGAGYGPVSAVAAGAPDGVDRKTAALAISHRSDFPSRLDAAIAAEARHPRRRKAELWGTVTDADPGRSPASADLWLRVVIWMVMVARRVRHDRRVIVHRAVVAGAGAGLALGLQRAAIAQLTRRGFDPGTDWAVQLVFASVWGFALMASLMGAGAVAASGLRRTEPAAPGKVVAVGGIAFAGAMLLIGLANGLSPTTRPMIPLVGLGCGLVLATALLVEWPGPARYARLLWVGAGFGAAQWLLTATSQLNVACDAGCRYALSLPIVRSASYYGPRLGDRFSELATRSTDWFAGVAVVDAAVAGVMLFTGAAVALWLEQRRGQ